ncbi:hypothetical protein ACM66Z_02825 [Sulfurovum sp. ST-21]|uniref:Uncharacterized protein n=1 Tax=Sulfurovum indicum TaxID=2779528 RepID=A0A7M1S5I7_9BACT|nr:hypothetical protein [Sulfurovum indicum]QOR62424.1 hypothetical protein IMZ28_02810 [Sulfurovum indicum]
MKKYPLYRLPIGYMLLYTLLILASGVWLFLLGQGLGENGSIVQTLNSLVSAPVQKSLYQFVEIATPHLFAMGTLIFVTAHFMLFSTKISQKFSLKVAMLLFTAALLDIAAYLLISTGLVVSGWVKIVALVLFVFLFLLLLGMVAFSL